MSWGLGVAQSFYFLGGVLALAAHSSGRDRLRRVAWMLLTMGIPFHVGWMVLRGIRAGHLPITDSYETMVFLSWLVVAIALAGWRRWAGAAVGGVAGLLGALGLAGSSLLSTEVQPLVPSLRSNWLLFHVATTFVAYAGFTLAAGTALARLMGRVPQDRRRVWDEATFRLIRFGFPLLTLGIATGSVWANVCWGSWWNWDPKETWAFVTWMLYAGYLHLASPRSGRGALCSLLAILAFVSVLFTYLGVNVFLTSLHAYA